MPWAEMFELFCGGVALSQIAEQYNIKIQTLQLVAARRDWAGARARYQQGGVRVDVDEDGQPRLSGGEVVPVAPTESGLKDRLVAVVASERITANREANLAVAEKLRELASRHIQAALDGTLRIKEQKVGKGGIYEVEREPTPMDLVAIATVAKGAAELSYAALGDVPGKDGKGRTGEEKGGNTYNVLMPAVFASKGPAGSEGLPSVEELRESLKAMTTVQPLPPRLETGSAGEADQGRRRGDPAGSAIEIGPANGGL
jgi:hypothetical protein